MAEFTVHGLWSTDPVTSSGMPDGPSAEIALWEFMEDRPPPPEFTTVRSRFWRAACWFVGHEDQDGSDLHGDGAVQCLMCGRVLLPEFSRPAVQAGARTLRGPSSERRDPHVWGDYHRHAGPMGRTDFHEPPTADRRAGRSSG